MRSPLPAPFALLLAALFAACSGQIAEPSGSDDPSRPGGGGGPGDPGDPSGPGGGPLGLSLGDDLDLYSRHTRSEYRYLLADLLVGADPTLRGEAWRTVEDFPENGYVGYYRHYAMVNAGTRLASQQLALARALAAAFVTSDLYRELCSGARCAENVADELLPLIWRRPLEADERAELIAFHAELPAKVRDEAFFTRLFASPWFHFEVFPPSPATDRDRARKRAHLLALALRGSYPDDALMEALEAGELDDADADWEPHVRRLLESYPDRFAVLFLPQWLGMASLYEEGTPFHEVSMRTVMTEPALIFASLVEDGDQPVTRLFALERNVVNGQLADLYGVDTGTAEWTPAEATRTLFGTAAMTVMFTDEETGFPNPIRRGAYIVNRLLCRSIQFPSSEVQSEIDRVLEEVPEGLSPPERMAWLRENPTCASCHEQFDHHGLALEEIGPLGETMETYYTGDPVVARGSVGELDYESSVDFVAQLGATDELHTCFAAQVHSYFSGGDPVDARQRLQSGAAGAFHGVPAKEVVVEMALLAFEGEETDR
ncbi:MAG TPA: DUF1588 domain-containing protein [Polyangiaceae bacterium LLY-WYZ-15_(1-7)]|nr:hypothetical protein [Myxococcales bacterium]MAT29736.1 hypothetical protein [Sandaracinus sp.]HJK91180.1 DUF1588 domain-containing protein [Polyangiaceae bacterium LLY-WYZ-15_(1-7)]MBJ75324.1 hypothetical protein [Sandaracinus sp.]HJL04990.1 DUF1588 domain-containing protein [Polyangiaceae bacterium LLY-WYZ-15_(1-7)]